MQCGLGQCAAFAELEKSGLVRNIGAPATAYLEEIIDV